MDKNCEHCKGKDKCNIYKTLQKLFTWEREFLEENIAKECDYYKQ